MQYAYEQDKYSFYVPEVGRVCGACGAKSVLRKSTYMPDFKIGTKVYIEAKGKLTAGNRKRLIAFKKAHPEVRIYIMFQRDNWLTSKRRAKYSDWARSEGFECAVGIEVPKEWK